MLFKTKDIFNLVFIYVFFFFFLHCSKNINEHNNLYLKVKTQRTSFETMKCYPYYSYKSYEYIGIFLLQVDFHLMFIFNISLIL